MKKIEEKANHIFRQMADNKRLASLKRDMSRGVDPESLKNSQWVVYGEADRGERK